MITGSRFTRLQDLTAEQQAAILAYEYPFTGNCEIITKRELLPNLNNPGLMDECIVKELCAEYNIAAKVYKRPGKKVYRASYYVMTVSIERTGIGDYYDTH